MKRESFVRARGIDNSLENIQNWRKWIERAKGYKESGLQLAVFDNGEGYNGHNYKLDSNMQTVLYGLLDTMLKDKEAALLNELETL